MFTPLAACVPLLMCDIICWHAIMYNHTARLYILNACVGHGMIRVGDEDCALLYCYVSGVVRQQHLCYYYSAPKVFDSKPRGTKLGIYFLNMSRGQLCGQNPDLPVLITGQWQ